MKVLFVSSSPINKSISIGNTFLNVFDGIEGVEFASIYTRNGLPDKQINRAFQITEKMIIKCLNVGEEVVERYKGESVVDSNGVFFAKKKRWSIFFILQNLIWRLPFWKSQKLKSFIDSYNPDVIFTVLSDSIPLNRLVRFVKKYSNKPLFLYAWDDNYSLKTSGKSPLKKILRIFARKQMRKTVSKSSQFYVISKVQKNDYEKWFNKDCKILTKSADFSKEPEIKTAYGNPLQLVYTGNIGMNRWKSLALISKVLQKLNKDCTKAQLRIYTSNAIYPEIKENLDITGTSYLMGSVPSNEVQNKQKEADILVHVEGLDERSVVETRQSFSTKLVDYFKSARPILAIGKQGVASIDHLKENNCAIIADNEEMLFCELKRVIDDPSILNNLSILSYNCGKKHHDKSAMKEMLIKDLNKYKI